MNASRATDERRRIPRSFMLKRAQIAAGEALYDCFIMDSSEAGVRVRTAAPIALPDRVMLRLTDGRNLTARSRWSRGTESGLEFDAESGKSRSDIAARAWAIHAVLEGGEVSEAIAQLRAERFFHDAAVRQAAEDAEGAQSRLAAALRACAMRTN